MSSSDALSVSRKGGEAATDRPLASMSLDLDNKWSYMKIHGDAGWQDYPSYLDVVVPRILDVLGRLEKRTTVFIVGLDATREENIEPLKSISASGHEIGNHSFHHEPWLHLYSREEIAAELEQAEHAIESATGRHPRGFRGPGFSVSPAVLDVLKERGYVYDASTFPTFLGPVARAYYFMTARMSAEEREKRNKLFGKFSEGFRPLKPYVWQLQAGPLLEIPVTTIPYAKVPFHLSYILYLASYSETVAHAYFVNALRMCRLSGVQPSLLLHPLDFLGGDDVPELKFFPAMGLSGAKKVQLTEALLQRYVSKFRVVTMQEHAEAALDAIRPTDRKLVPEVQFAK